MFRDAFVLLVVNVSLRLKTLLGSYSSTLNAVSALTPTDNTTSMSHDTLALGININTTTSTTSSVPDINSTTRASINTVAEPKNESVSSQVYFNTKLNQS